MSVSLSLSLSLLGEPQGEQCCALMGYVKTVIKYHQDTMSMFIQFNLCIHSNYCSVRLPASTSSHGSYIVTSVISYYSCMQQGVDRHPCLVTIYSLFTDTGQEVLAPTVSTQNRHQLSHQLSVVTASTLYPAPDTYLRI